MEENQHQTRKFSIKDTSATKKIFSLSKRIRAVSGGTSASKTVSILIWLIDYCQSTKNVNKLATVVSESHPHLLGGSIEDFQVIMKDRDYWNEKRWVRNPKAIYTFETGNRLEFYSVDTYGKAHGPRRDVLFVNEANNLAYNIVDQLIIRTRETIWLDWNPTAEFWFYTEMEGRRDDIDFITLTYLDNEALDESTVREIESHKHLKNWWKIYGLGLMGELEGLIYKGWKMIDDIPHEARLEGYGLDFGYSNDETALVAVYWYNGGYIVDERLYQKGLSNKQIADVILAQEENALVVADSAEPKSIDEIYSYGVMIVGAKKGKDSVNHGIQFVQQQKISVTKRSLNINKERRNYMWMEDKEGKTLNKPIDLFNHLMDAIRYRLNSEEKVQEWTPNDPGGVKPFYPGMPG
ncbi:MAG TPA: terminase [bacterium]|nr:terminase [bacterium]